MAHTETSGVDYAEKYDIFLSYRRDGGEAMAILLRDRLTERGYSVFLDIENLNSGSFNTKLFDVMDNCKDVLVICSKGSLDRCVNDGDWVRLEIARALEKGKNIIPVILRGFNFPDAMPADIEALRRQNGLNAISHEYFDAAVDRLASKFLKSTPALNIPLMTERLHKLVNQSNSKKPKKRKFTTLAAIIPVCVIILTAVVNIFGGKKTEITIYNNTADTIHSICFKRSDADNWGKNIVGNGSLVSGETVIIRLPQKDTQLNVTWDMRNIFYQGDMNYTFLLEGFSMYELNGIVIYALENGGYEREFLRD